MRRSLATIAITIATVAAGCGADEEGEQNQAAESCPPLLYVRFDDDATRRQMQRVQRALKRQQAVVSVRLFSAAENLARLKKQFPERKKLQAPPSIEARVQSGVDPQDVAERLTPRPPGVAELRVYAENSVCGAR